MLYSILVGIIVLFAGMIGIGIYRLGKQEQVTTDLKQEEKAENEATKINADIDTLSPDAARNELLNKFSR
jgi:uncharacterized protein (UPF0333 family)